MTGQRHLVAWCLALGIGTPRSLFGFLLVFLDRTKLPLGEFLNIWDHPLTHGPNPVLLPVAFALGGGIGIGLKAKAHKSLHQQHVAVSASSLVVFFVASMGNQKEDHHVFSCVFFFFFFLVVHLKRDTPCE